MAQSSMEGAFVTFISRGAQGGAALAHREQPEPRGCPCLGIFEAMPTKALEFVAGVRCCATLKCHQ